MFGWYKLTVTKTKSWKEKARARIVDFQWSGSGSYMRMLTLIFEVRELFVLSLTCSICDPLHGFIPIFDSHRSG